MKVEQIRKFLEKIELSNVVFESEAGLKVKVSKENRLKIGSLELKKRSSPGNLVLTDKYLFFLPNLVSGSAMVKDGTESISNEIIKEIGDKVPVAAIGILFSQIVLGNILDKEPIDDIQEQENMLRQLTTICGFVAPIDEILKVKLAFSSVTITTKIPDYEEISLVFEDGTAHSQAELFQIEFHKIKGWEAPEVKLFHYRMLSFFYFIFGVFFIGIILFGGFGFSIMGFIPVTPIILIMGFIMMVIGFRGSINPSYMRNFFLDK